jgi:hypothetical protein
MRIDRHGERIVMQGDGTILVGKAPLKDGTLKPEGLTLRLAN